MLAHWELAASNLSRSPVQVSGAHRRVTRGTFPLDADMEQKRASRAKEHHTNLILLVLHTID